LTADNNHKHIIVDLEENGLLFKAPNDNPETEIYPVYLVDRTLMQGSFKVPLRELYGETFDSLGIDYQEIMETIYQLEMYGKDIQISANYTATFIFIQKYGQSSDVQAYESYRAKVRNIFRNLEKKKYIYKPNPKKYDFRLNTNFKKTPTLF